MDNLIWKAPRSIHPVPVPSLDKIFTYLQVQHLLHPPPQNHLRSADVSVLGLRLVPSPLPSISGWNFVATTCGSGFIISCQPESTSTLTDAPNKGYQKHLWRQPVYLGWRLISQKVHRLLSKPMLSPQVRLLSLSYSGIPLNLPLCSLREICERIAVKVRYLYWYTCYAAINVCTH